MIARKTSNDFGEMSEDNDEETPLRESSAEATGAIGKTPHDAKAKYGTAGSMGNHPAVLDI